MTAFPPKLGTVGHWPAIGRSSLTQRVLRVSPGTNRLFHGSPSLPKSDLSAWPALAGSAISGQSHAKILDGSQMFDDRLAINGEYVN
jgi:hypothetical protein